MQSYAKDWDTLMREYIRYMRFERNFSANTREAYERDIREFREFLELEEDTEQIMPADVRPLDIESYLASIYDRKQEVNTQARKLSGVKSFFSFLVISDVISKSPVEFIDAPRIGRKLPEVLSLPEIDSMLDTIDLSHPQGHRNRAILETLYSCGLRVSELISLRLGDMFFNDGFIRVIGKGDKQRLVPVSALAIDNITMWLAQRKEMAIDAKHQDIVFLSRYGRKLSRVMVFNIIRNIARDAGIEKQVSPHTLRHSFATHLLEGGAGIRQVQDLLGHESILTTEVYTHIDRTHLRKAIEDHHPMSEK